MIFFVDCNWYDKQTNRFRDNLRDWSLGGPKEGGWTRFGSVQHLPAFPESIFLRRFQKTMLPIEDILAKNIDEVVNRWHVPFLTEGLEQSLYWSEYLEPRYDKYERRSRATSFSMLHRDMMENGFDETKPAYVADLQGVMDLGFRYFRFDGCHRTASAHVCGLKEIPTLVFSLEVSPQHSLL